MSNETPAAPDRSVAPESATRAKSRRRFVQGVGVLVPTILTVSARSSLAANCMSPSASTSINLTNSRPAGTSNVVCTGKSPGYWKNSEAKYANGFPASIIFGGAFPDKTMLDIVSLSRNQNHEALARHLAAAYCNLQKGWVPSAILDETDLRNMWLGRNGSYSPIGGRGIERTDAPISGAGVTWGEDQIVYYLTTYTMHTKI